MTCPQSADPRGPLNPQPRPLTQATRFAVSAGPLTLPRLNARIAESERLGDSPLAVFTEAELLHLQLIQKTLPPGSDWEDATDAIRDAAAG